MSKSIEDPVRHLREENDIVLEWVDRMEIAAGDLSGSRRAEALTVLREGLAFLKQEVGAHMRLEEETLYPVMAKHVPVQMVMVMLEEHRDISWALARLEQGLEAGLRSRSDRWHAIAVVDLLRRHIDKENNLWFMMAAQMLSGDEYQELTNALNAALERGCEV